MQSMLRGGFPCLLVRDGAPRPAIFAIFLLAIFAGSAFAQIAPVITSISQTVSTAGAPGYTLVVNTNNFTNTPPPQVFFGNTGLVTNQVTAVQYTAQVTAAVLAAQGTFNVTMQASTGTSLPITYTVLPPPIITGFNPISVTAGNAPQFFHVLGANYVVNGSITDTVQWDTIPFTPTAVQSGDLTISLSAAAVTQGTHNVTVITSDGVQSNTLQVAANPPPTLTSLSQNISTATASGFSLGLNGTNFVNGMTVIWNNTSITQITSLTITSLAANQITATVPASLIAAPASATLTVFAPDGVPTQSLGYTILPVPNISTLAPNTITAGHAQFLMNVTGSVVPANSTVKWNGANRPTSNPSPGDQQATIPASDVATAGTTATVTLISFDGVSSNGLPFTVTSAPTITSFSPVSRTAAQGQFTLTINGANFVNGDSVTWNGGGLTITSLTANQIQVTVPGALTQLSGTAQIAVISPDGVSSGNSPYIVNALPTLTSISPTSHTAGAAAFTLTAAGANFVNGMTVNWNGSPRTTTFVSATQLTAAISANDIASPNTTANVTVVTADGFSSNIVTFSVSPAPVLSAISPSLRTATAPSFTLTATGSNFVNGTTVQWNGVSQSTTFVSATQLTASVPAALIAQPGIAQVTVISPDGVGSNQVPFQIAPIPTLSSLSPAAATAGSAGFTLTATGTNFLNGNLVNQVVFGGTPLATTFVSATSLLAAVPANLITAPGPVNVSVLGPGGVSSNSQVFTINGPLTITGGPPKAFTVGVPYLGKNTATGGTPPYVWSAAGLPPGLTINPTTGDITGTPIIGGSFALAVTVTDASKQSATAIYNVGATPPPPQIVTGSTLPPGTVGVKYVTLFGASGGSSTFSWSLSGGSLPDGLSLSADGLLSGTPTKPGTFNFGVLATDSTGVTASRGFSLLIQPAPLAVTGSAGDATVGSPLSITFGATGGIPPYKFGVSGSIPPGTSFSGGTLSGTPNSSGTFGFTVSVTDSAGAVATRSFSITVAPASLAVTGAPGDGQVGVGYSAKVGATGGTPPYQFSGSGGPAGLSLSINGTLSGTPTAEGQFSLSVTVTDAAGAKATRNFSITIIPAALGITTVSLPDGAVNAAYSAAVTATGGVKPYIFTISGLPDGVSAGSDGSIGGTPKSVGTFTITATVKDAAGKTATQSFNVTIAVAPLTLAASANNGTVGAAYSGSATASGGVPPYTYSASGLPAGVSIASGTGAISGTPTAPGTASVTVTVKDSAGTTASRSFQVAIGLPAAPPVTLSGVSSTGTPAVPQNVQVVLGNPYPLDVTVTLTLTFAPDAGPDDPTVVFSAGGRTARVVIPAGATVAPGNVGVQTGTVAGAITITAQLLAGGADITPTPAPRSTIRINAAAPVVTTATATRNSTGFTVVITGYVTDREITQVIFAFTPAPGSNLQTSSITIPVDALFGQWYSSAAAAAFGSQFTFTQPFTVQGSSQTIVSVTVTLVNKVGSSTPVTATLQ